MTSIAASAALERSALFEVIPSFLRTREQVARWRDAGEAPTYRLLRNPVDLNELNNYEFCMAIWRENGTLTYLTPHGQDDHPRVDVRFFRLKYHGGGPILNIIGTSDEAIAETASFFMCLEKPNDRSSHLVVESIWGKCDFRSVGTRCFTHMFDVAPSRPVEFKTIKLSVEQSIALATRPQPTSMDFYYCDFDDVGNSFVDALERRTLSFGTLRYKGSSTFSDNNLRRILQLDHVIEELSVPGLDGELALLPFSANVRRLDCDIWTGLSRLPVIGLDSVNVVASKLSIRILHDGNGPFATDAVFSLFRRLADLGHFTELKVSFWSYDDDSNVPSGVVQALIRAALANGNLEILDLSTLEDDEDLDWDPYVGTLMEGLKHHAELRTLKLEVGNDAFGPDFCHLRQFLSYHRKITVTDRDGRIHSDGSSIDSLYALNRLYWGSASLLTESLSGRSSLVTATLMESASGDFRRSALLLLDHTDVLHDLVQFARFDELGEDGSASQMDLDNVPE